MLSDHRPRVWLPLSWMCRVGGIGGFWHSEAPVERTFATRSRVLHCGSRHFFDKGVEVTGSPARAGVSEPVGNIAFQNTVNIFRRRDFGCDSNRVFHGPPALWLN